MASINNELSLKLLIDAKAQKVCFGEAGSDVVEFVSSLLSLPLGTVTDLLTKERMVGSVSNFLGSMKQLHANYKSKGPQLTLAAAERDRGKLTLVGDGTDSRRMGAAAAPSVLPASTSPSVIALLAPASLSIALLVQCGVKDLSVLEEKIVKIDKEKALGILAAAFKSKTVLTDVFPTKKNARCKREPPEEVI